MLQQLVQCLRSAGPGFPCMLGKTPVLLPQGLRAFSIGGSTISKPMEAKFGGAQVGTTDGANGNPDGNEQGASPAAAKEALKDAGLPTGAHQGNAPQPPVSAPPDSAPSQKGVEPHPAYSGAPEQPANPWVDTGGSPPITP